VTEPDGIDPAAGGSSERIAKRIARAGLCSRRDAERWIEEGRVKVDGEVLTSPAVTVTAESRIEVDGAPLPAAAAARLFRLHKPKGYLTAARDPEGRKTIADLIPPGLPRLMPIGRLDMNSEGLLLLTNDGALKRQLELPSTGWRRRYRVRVHGDVDEAKLAGLKDGISIDGFDYGPIEAVLERRIGRNAWLSVALREGKNREIRRVMEHFGWPVNRLIRVSFGPFHLGNLPKAAIEEIKTKVVKEQVGPVLQSATPASQRKRRLADKARPKAEAAKNAGDANERSKTNAKAKTASGKTQRRRGGRLKAQQ
jgi:23S rRNA pseudouridine2605 synthase